MSTTTTACEQRLVHTRHQYCELESYDRPECGPDDVAGPTIGTLISPGTELNFNYCGDKFPTCSGYSGCFEITHKGENVTDFEIGDQVISMCNHGSWAQKNQNAVVKIPKGLDPYLATVARLMMVTHTSILTTKARPGEKVVVMGLGPVGLLGALQCQGIGYEVLCCDLDPARRATAEAAGLATAESLPEDFGAALALECSGHEAATLACCKAVRKCGEVVLVGVPWQKRCDLDAHSILHAVFHNYVYLRSGWEWEIPLKVDHFSDIHTTKNNWSTCMKWLKDGRVKISEDIIGICDPNQANDIYQSHLNHKIDHLCSVFKWNA